MGAAIYLESQRLKNKKQYQGLLDAAMYKRDTWVQANNHLKNIHQLPEYEKAQAEVNYYIEIIDKDCYIRESYNNSSLFILINLNWETSISNHLTKSGKMHLGGMIELKDQVERFNIDTHKIKQLFPKETQEWVTYFNEKKSSILKLLETAIQKKEKLHFII